MELRPLPQEIYARAGIDPIPPTDLDRVTAMRRVMAYRAARDAILAEQVAAFTPENPPVATDEPAAREAAQGLGHVAIVNQ